MLSSESTRRRARRRSWQAPFEKVTLSKSDSRQEKERREILDAGALPVPVKAAIYQRDGFKTVVFDLVEE